MLRSMVKAFADQLMSAEASAICNAGYGEVTPARVNQRNGCLRGAVVARLGRGFEKAPTC
jgi:transposase-like protein